MTDYHHNDSDSKNNSNNNHHVPGSLISRAITRGGRPGNLRLFRAKDDESASPPVPSSNPVLRVLPDPPEFYTIRYFKAPQDLPTAPDLEWPGMSWDAVRRFALGHAYPDGWQVVSEQTGEILYLEEISAALQSQPITPLTCYGTGRYTPTQPGCPDGS